MWHQLSLCMAVHYLGVDLVAAQCGPGGAAPYPPGKSECPAVADGQAPHSAGNTAPAPASPSSSGTCSTPPCPCSMLGDIGFTTVKGYDKRSGITFQPGENIYGPFEAGFGSSQNSILEQLGCANGNDGHVIGGIDVETAEQLVAYQCKITLPRIEGNEYISLLDECGGHTKEYHFHQKLSCLYQASGAHSGKVGEAQDGQSIYGMWEHTDNDEFPLLDACGGHFGVTPDSNGQKVYHYQIQPSAPFTVGCFGPSKNDEGNDKLVTLAECRALYSGCGNGDVVSLTTSAGTFNYDPWCPCYDAEGSNVGMVELAVFSQPDQVTCVGTCSSFQPVALEQGGQSGVPILMVVAIAGFACFLGVAIMFVVNRVQASKRHLVGDESEDEDEG